jgi:hypothetical protein
LWIEILCEVFMPNFKNIKVPNTKMLGRSHKCFCWHFQTFSKKEKYDTFLRKHDKKTMCSPPNIKFLFPTEDKQQWKKPKREIQSIRCPNIS